jgi:hypothetical protein
MESIEFSKLFLGALFWLYTSIILTHIENILMFRYVIKNPEEIEGELKLSIKYSYGTSKNKVWNIGLLCLLVSFLLSELFFLGGFFGALFKFLILSRWGSKVSKEGISREGDQLIREDQTEEEVEDTDKSAIFSCPSCRQEVPMNSKFCGFCGFYLKELLICQACQRRIPLKTKYCIYCGVKRE